MKTTGTWTRLLAGVAVAAAAGGMAATAGEVVIERCMVSLGEDGEAQVAAREAGVIEELKARKGMEVAAEADLAILDSDQPRMELEKAQAELAQARAKATSDVDERFAVASEGAAQKAFEKAQSSATAVRASVTDVERDRLKLEWEKSGLQIEQAQLERQLSALAAKVKEAEVETADIEIRRRLVTSPLDGEVVDVQGNQGEWMQVGAPLAHVVRTDKLRVEGYVDAAKWDPERVRGRPVTVVVPLADGRMETFEGRISFVSPLVESGGDYRVFAEVANRRAAGSGEWLLRAGQTATMTIHSDRPAGP